jgi:hypothetical protein
VQATADAEVMQALEKLLNELKSAKIGGESVAQLTANISGDAIVGIGVAQNVSIGAQNVGASPKRDRR